MIYHVLNGDGLAGSFDLEGEIVVCRECLIEGNLKAESLEEFWRIRSKFVKSTYKDNSYFEKVQKEFKKLDNLNPTDEVNLWFGNEAFCQVNMWFILSLIWKKETKFYRVFPDSGGWDCGFKDLQKCFESRLSLANDDLQLGKQLWEAVCFNNFEKLKELGETDSSCFIRLNEVCQALIEKDTKPRELLREIIEKGENDFAKIFVQFQATAGVYGFGDLQVKSVLQKI